MISAPACGMPALAVSSDQAWDSAWALGFEDRDVTIVMDADRAGRLAAQRIQGDLTDVAPTVTITDLAPDRQDGYDLTDWLHGHRHPSPPYPSVHVVARRVARRCVTSQKNPSPSNPVRTAEPLRAEG